MSQEHKWRPIGTAPKDSSLIVLLVDYADDNAAHALEDDVIARTIGFNSFDHNGEDEWKFAGWCWTHDHFVQGKGVPIMWAPLLAAPTLSEIGGPRLDEQHPEPSAANPNVPPGYCPQCGERVLDGRDRCGSGHLQPGAEASKA